MLSKCLLHCETVILVLYFTTGKTLKANNTYTKFLCVKNPNRICETTYGLRDTIMKDLVILGTDSLFPPLTLFLWVGEKKEITKSRDKESMPKQYDFICSLASPILTLCHTKSSDFRQRCVTRPQFPLFMSQQCVHLKKSCFRCCDRGE